MAEENLYEDLGLPEDSTYFIDCTCEHEPEKHGWSECEIEGCDCKGHWEY